MYKLTRATCSRVVVSAALRRCSQPLTHRFTPIVSHSTPSGAASLSTSGSRWIHREQEHRGSRQAFAEEEHDLQELPVVEKREYKERPAPSGRSQADVEAWLKENEVTLSGTDPPRPALGFEESGFDERIVSMLKKNYEAPFGIQSISWPVATSGRDLISIAKTGSGKTLGFLLPGLVHAAAQPPRRRGDGPIVLILAPTRELAQQVEAVARPYCRAMGLNVACVFGGANRNPQMDLLAQGVDVCIATPGRLQDFLECRATHLQRCSYLVLDEADRMLDMGFEPQIRRIVQQLKPDRQTLMFSATWPSEVRELASDFLQDPVHVTVGSLELAANKNITQEVEIIDGYKKQRRLMELLDGWRGQKTLIFCQTKRMCDDLQRALWRGRHDANCIHGDKSQRHRDTVLEKFRSGATSILIATDVAARGLDVSDIKYVVNYDFPQNSEDYVHRIGRTGRQDKKGTSYTFFTSEDAPRARDLVKIMEQADQKIPPLLTQMAANMRGSASPNNTRYSGGYTHRHGVSSFGGRPSTHHGHGGFQRSRSFDHGGSRGGGSFRPSGRRFDNDYDDEFDGERNERAPSFRSRSFDDGARRHVERGTNRRDYFRRGEE